ncbi:hypothetical protein Tco_0575750 [Tanacetum coccineum]
MPQVSFSWFGGRGSKRKPRMMSVESRAFRGPTLLERNPFVLGFLVDEPDEEPAHFEPEPEPEQEGVGEEYDMECAIQMSLELFQPQGKAIITEEQAIQSLLALRAPKRRSTTDQFILQRWTPATKEASIGQSAQPQDDTSTNIVRDSTSPTDAKTRAESDKTNSGELDQDQAGSDPGESLES